MSKKKLDFTLLPVEFDDVVLVLQNSAESGKYEAKGWEKGKDFEAEKNLASTKRHINDYRMGLRLDADSGLHPLLHAACRCLMQYTLDKRAASGFQSAASTIPVPTITKWTKAELEEFNKYAGMSQFDVKETKRVVGAIDECRTKLEQKALSDTNKPMKFQPTSHTNLRAHITNYLCGIPNCTQCAKERRT